MIFSMALLALTLTSAGKTNDTDPIRQQIRWEAPAFPSNEEGFIEKLYLTYYTSDGQRHDIVSDMSLPMPADAFAGGDIEEPDINFDGIPDLQVSVGYMNATGHNPVYNWYVWDVRSHSFVEVDNVSIINPTLNEEEKTIYTHMLEGGTMYVDSYRWKGLQLEKTGEWAEDWSEMTE